MTCSGCTGLTRAAATSRRCLRSGRGAEGRLLLGRSCRVSARCARSSPRVYRCRSRAPPPPTAARRRRPSGATSPAAPAWGWRRARAPTTRAYVVPVPGGASRSRSPPAPARTRRAREWPRTVWRRAASSLTSAPGPMASRPRMVARQTPHVRKRPLGSAAARHSTASCTPGAGAVGSGRRFILWRPHGVPFGAPCNERRRHGHTSHTAKRRAS